MAWSRSSKSSAEFCQATTIIYSVLSFFLCNLFISRTLALKEEEKEDEKKEKSVEKKI
jgi:hypothetical protein